VVTINNPMTSFCCRSCGSSQGVLVLDLGVQPLANNLLLSTDLGKPEPKFPLRVALCEACWLLQITDIIPPVELFGEYLYFSSFSDAALRHAAGAAEKHVRAFALGPESFVIEIASNDGYLLKNFVAAGVPCLGIEPAANIAKAAIERGVPTLSRFFGRELAMELAEEGRHADLILGNNVFAHVPDPNSFVAGCATLLKPAGRIVLEFPYVCDLVEKVEFDTIYHEHVFYFSLTSLQPLFAGHGLEITGAERIPIHGGSLRLYAGRRGAQPVMPEVLSLLAEENAKGMASARYYEDFAGRVCGIRDDLLSLLRKLKAGGHSIAAYGASAKGSTLLNFCGLGSETLDFVADRSTAKQGRLTPGAHLAIVPPEQLSERRPDYTVLLTWNFADEILEQQKTYRDAGGKFVIPIPTVVVV
jgi:SAM-dependent methyltransferase